MPPYFGIIVSWRYVDAVIFFHWASHNHTYLQRMITLIICLLWVKVVANKDFGDSTEMDFDLPDL